MGTLLIDTLLTECVKRRASELHLAVDQPPMVRVGDGTQNLTTAALGPADLSGIVETITPQRCKRELQEVGETSFNFGFGDEARVRTIITQRDGVSVIKLQVS